VYITSTSVTLRYRSTYGDTSCSVATDSPLPAPGGIGGAATYTVTATGGATLSPASLNFYFDRVGKPSFGSNQTITVSGARSMVVEAETGYVH
jgi:hypothetical protein